MAITSGGGPEPGSHFGRYTLVRRIGSGGMGDVFEARHIELNKRVAIKTMRRDRARDAEARARFVREGQAAARVRHPNVVEVSDVGTWGDTPFLVMEYLEGVDLAAWLAREGRVAVETIAELMLPVLAAVAAAHEEGVLHRDLKPANIFLSRTRDGALQPKVVDFGISWVTSGSDVHGMTSTNALLGTPAYMAPEQTRSSREVSAASDQYALGVILYECATGRHPFDPGPLFALLLRIGKGEFRAPRVLRPEIDAAFEAVVLRAMALDPAQRFASVRELGRALLPFAGDRGRMLWGRVFDASATLHGLQLEPGVSGTAATQPAPTTLSSSVQQRLVQGARRVDRRVPVGLAALLVGALGAWGAVSVTGAGRREEVARFEVSLEVAPSGATLTLDGVDVGVGALRRAFAADGTTHVLAVSAPGYAPQELVFVNAPPEATRVTLVAREVAPVVQRVSAPVGVAPVVPSAPAVPVVAPHGRVRARAPSPRAPREHAQPTHETGTNGVWTGG